MKSIIFLVFYSLILTEISAQSPNSPDSLEIKYPLLRRAKVEVYSLQDHKPDPRYASWRSIYGGMRFAGSLKDGIVFLANTTIQRTRFSKEPPLTYVSFRAEGIHNNDMAEAYINATMQEIYRYSVENIRDSVEVIAIYCRDSSLLGKHPVEYDEYGGWTGTWAGGELIDGKFTIFSICGFQPDIAIGSIEKYFNEIVFFEGFPDMTNYYFDFPLPYFHDLHAMRKHLAQWGIELRGEKRLVDLKYVEMK
jgi:hypothetical protein